MTLKKQTKMIVGITAGVLLVSIIVVAAVLMRSSGNRKEYDKHMETARQYMEAFEYERAIEEYGAAIEIEPNKIESYQALAELYVQIGDYDSATEVLNRGIERTGAGELTEYLEQVLSIWEVKQAEQDVAQAEMEPSQDQGVSQEVVQELHEDIDGYETGEKTIYYDDGSYWVNEYDENGYCVKGTSYNADGTIAFYWIHEEYDEDRNCVKSTKYNANDVVDFYVVYEYDGSGNRVNTAYYNADGTVDKYFHEEYDGNGNRVKASWHNADGTLEEYYVEEYDGDGNCVKTTWYNADGMVTGIYDANGNWIDIHENIEGNGARQETVDDPNGEGYWIDEYDENGNRVKESWYFTGIVEDGELISYIIVGHDGDCIKFTRYMADGTLDWYVVEEYDGFGVCVKITCYSADGAVEWIEDCGGEIEKIVTNGVRWHRGMYYEFDLYDVNGEKVRHGHHYAGYTEIVYDVLYDRDGHYVSIAGYRGDGTIQWEQEVDENGNPLNIISYNQDGSVYMISPMT